MTDSQETNSYDEAAAIASLQNQLRNYGINAIRYGHADRAWVNQRLTRLGIPGLAGTAEYRINTPVSGLFGATFHANSRTEAMEMFNAHLDNAKTAGKINDCHERGFNVYELAFSLNAPSFFSGPEDIPAPDEVSLSLDEFKTQVRQMLKDAVVEIGWGYDYATTALSEMGLPALPPISTKEVKVPVSGTTTIHIPTFDDDDDSAVDQAVAAYMKRQGLVAIKPEEVGDAQYERPSVGFTLVDDEDEGPQHVDNIEKF